MSNGEKAVKKYIICKSAVFFAVLNVLGALLCGAGNYTAGAESYDAVNILQFSFGMLIPMAAQTVMNNFITRGKALFNVPIKRERAAGLCLDICAALSAVPYITEIILAATFAAVGIISPGGLFAAVSLSLLAMMITLYFSAWFLHHFSSNIDFESKKRVSRFIFQLVSLFAYGFDGLFARLALNTSAGPGFAVPAAVGVIMLVYYIPFRKKSIKKFLERQEEYL